MTYRRPTVYIPPYNYCDRICERCAIDKSRCLLYQRETDVRLHREIDGLGEPTMEETVDRIVKDAHHALELVREQAREMGVEVEEAGRGAVEEPPPRIEADPIVREAELLGEGLSGFVRKQSRDFPEECAVVAHSLLMPAAKLERASRPAQDAVEKADSILQAQVVDRLLGEASQALSSIRKKRPALGDATLDLSRLLDSLRQEIEERWLSLPCDLLEPAPPGEWWGPLRDITPTLRHFRR